jgi:hypothetical protein
MVSALLSLFAVLWCKLYCTFLVCVCYLTVACILRSPVFCLVHWKLLQICVVKLSSSGDDGVFSLWRLQIKGHFPFSAIFFKFIREVDTSSGSIGGKFVDPILRCVSVAHRLIKHGRWRWN